MNQPVPRRGFFQRDAVAGSLRRFFPSADGIAPRSRVRCGFRSTHFVSPGQLRGRNGFARSRAGVVRDLCRHGLVGDAPDTRDRHPHGGGSRSGVGGRPDLEIRVPAERNRSRSGAGAELGVWKSYGRNGGCIDERAGVDGGLLWNASAGSGGRVRARAARVEARSDHSPQAGVDAGGPEDRRQLTLRLLDSKSPVPDFSRRQIWSGLFILLSETAMLAGRLPTTRGGGYCTFNFAHCQALGVSGRALSLTSTRTR